MSTTPVPQSRFHPILATIKTKVIEYGPETLSMITVAALAYKVWGDTILIIAAMIALTAFAFRHQIKELYQKVSDFIDITERIPSAARAFMSPAASVLAVSFFGLPGLAAVTAVNGISYGIEELRLHRVVVDLRQTSIEAQRQNADLQRLNSDYKAQVEQSKATVARIIQLCPNLTNLQNNVTGVHEVIQKFVQQYERVMSNSEVFPLLQKIDQLERLIASLIAKLKHENNVLDERQKDDARHYSNLSELEDRRREQIDRLNALLENRSGENHQREG